jgi:hypothetical protein
MHACNIDAVFQARIGRCVSPLNGPDRDARNC